MRRLTLTAAALLGAAVIFLLATLPPPPLEIPLSTVAEDLLRRTVRGAYHVHTTRSDGAGTREEVAAAAARAGLQFVIFTDHGDGTRPPMPPMYIDGVLCLDGVEVSTNGGHYVALDLPATPYPLGGEAAAVAEDVARLGGFGIVAHPDHPRPEIAWSDWTVPIDGIEWINLDAEWRNDGFFALARVPFDYLWRPAAAIGSLLDRPVRTLERWDALQRVGPVVALAAADAHGAGSREGEGRAARLGIGPGYEAGFRTSSNRVLLNDRLTGDPNADGRQVLDAIRRGSVYSVIDAVSEGAVLRRAGPDGPFELSSPLPPGGRSVVIRESSRSRLEVHSEGSPGVPPVPWVLGNWTGERVSTPATQPAAPPVTAPAELASSWRVEKDPASTGEIRVIGDSLTLHYALGTTGSSSFVAAVADLRPNRPFTGWTFAARAVNPMRVSVQVRFPGGRRWIRSVYIGPDARQVSVDAEDMRSAEPTTARMPDAATATSVLFVVDLVNARPGTAGSFTLEHLRRIE